MAALMAMGLSVCSVVIAHHNMYSCSHRTASYPSSSYMHLKELRWSTTKRISGLKRLTRPHAFNNADEDEAQVSLSDTSKDDLAAKLAAAEAEAEALRRELAARRGGKEIDLAKLKPAVPEKRIDGVGYRETIFSTPGQAIGKEEKQPSEWGLSEAELFLSKGAPTERSQIGGSSIEDNSNKVVRRRLIIGTGIALLALSLSFFKLPTGLVKPSKPLFVYVIPIIRLRDQLMTIENTASDANSVRFQLKKLSESGDVSKEVFLSASGYLGGADGETASSLAYSIFDYLNQADYNKYFQYIGKPSASQQLDFLKFSLKSIQAAREQIDKFLLLIPQEDLQAAQSQIMR